MAQGDELPRARDTLVKDIKKRKTSVVFCVFYIFGNSSNCTHTTEVSECIALHQEGSQTTTSVTQDIDPSRPNALAKVRNPSFPVRLTIPIE